MKRLLDFLGLVPGFGVIRSVASIAWSIIGPVLRWIFSDWRHMAIVGLLAVAFQQDRCTIPQLESDLADERAKSEACEGTVANLKAAAEQAEAAQAANIARVKAERAANDERIVHAYQDRIAALRARADALAGRLSPDTAPTAAGLSGNGAVPTRVGGAGGSAEATDDQGFPLAAGAICSPMTLHERLIASEQAEQLDALIDAVEAQQAVSTAP